MFLEVSASFQTDSAIHLTCSVVDEKPFTFAVSTLVSSLLEHSPNAERLHIPPCCVEPKRHLQVWAAFQWVRWTESGG
jgi:hypothetical protein